MPCDCITKVNEKLREKDVELELAFLVPSFNAAIPIQTKWVAGIKKRKKPTTILASFCPFCGDKVEVSTGI